MTKVPSLRRVSGKKDTFECSVCHEKFERTPDASASREFMAHVRSKHKAEDVNQAAFRVMRESTENEALALSNISICSPTAKCQE